MSSASPQSSKGEMQSDLQSRKEGRPDGSVETVVCRSAEGAELTLSNLIEWSDNFEKSSTLILSLAQLVLSKCDPLPPLLVSSTVNQTARTFNLQLKGIGPNGVYPGPIGDQVDSTSGRCWLFATTNVLRYHMMNRLNLDEFQLSQSHLFFYDKLEKANFYLENVLETREEPIDSQMMLHLNRDPITDGGNWDMAINLIEKYGLIPHSLFPDSYSSKNTSRLNQILTSKLREYAIQLRANPDRSLKAQFLVEVYTTLSVILGTPPRPDEMIKWEYLGRDGECQCWEGTSLDFYHQYLKKEISPRDYFNLINDPRNEYDKLYTIERYGNIWESDKIKFVNAPIEALENAVISCIKANTPIYFAADDSKSISRDLGIWDKNLYDLKSAYGFEYNMSKADRLRTGETSMTHAMVFIAVHLDPEGKAVRYKVENSWSDKVGDKGFFMMTAEWFRENVFQVTIPRSLADEKWVKVLDGGDATELKAWDVLSY